MGQLHELLAVEGDINGEQNRIVQEAIVTFGKKTNLFTGAHRKLEYFDEARKAEEYEEHQEMVTTVPEKLDYVKDAVIRYFDAVLQKEKTNQIAKADLVVDGVTIGKELPACFLLGLESKLKALRALYEAVPTLQPGLTWEKDETQRKGAYKSKHPQKKFKTEKTFQHKVLVEPTDRHPAQIEKWEENVNVGTYITDMWSGMLTPAEKSLLIRRVDKLIRATKKARMRANKAEIQEVEIGKEIFTFIHQEIVD